ncbi:retrovirus-related pol polyprotein from transposon TNT 1-94 [Tanacetum coccineum]
MHGNETPDAYLNHAQEYVDALAAIGEPVKDKDLIMLKLSSLTFSGGLLKLSAPGLQVSPFAPFAPSEPQAFYGARPLNNNNRSNNNNNHGNRNNSRGNKNNRGHAQFAFDIPNTTSLPLSKTSPYYSSESPYIIPTIGHPSPSLPHSPISSPSSVSHLRPIYQTSPEPSNGQPLPVPYNPSVNHAIVLLTTITEPTSFTIANNSIKWCQAMKEEYDALVKNGTWSLVPHACNTNVVDCKWVYMLKRAKNGAITRYKARFVAKGFHQQPGNNKGTIDNIICQLGFDFALKDLGPLNYFLDIKIVPHVSGILLSQKKYILELLQRAGLSNCNHVSSLKVTLSRPNLAFAVNKLCQYMHAPTNNHWSAVKWILRYFYGTVEHGMLICRSFYSTLQAFIDLLWKGNSDTSLEAFSDVDWAKDSDDRRSIRGFAIYLEVEYKALADTVAERTWLQALLHELGIRSFSIPILWCDNLGATYLSANPIFHARTKHM